MKISVGKAYFMMFNVADGGIVEPIEFDKGNLMPDKSIIVMDEENLTVWLWHGKLRGLVQRRMALRQAESLKGHGYQAGNAIIGRGLEKIIEIDSRKVDRDPETTELNKKLEELLNHSYNPVGNFVYVQGGVGSSIASEPKKTPEKKKEEPKPEPKAEEKKNWNESKNVSKDSKPSTPKQYTQKKETTSDDKNMEKILSELNEIKKKLSEAEEKLECADNDVEEYQKKIKELENKLKETTSALEEAEKQLNEAKEAATTAEKRAENAEKAEKEQASEAASSVLSDEQKKLLKMGAVLFALAEEYKDLWISLKDDGSISVEQMDGKICTYKVGADGVEFKEGSFDGNTEKLEEIKARITEMTQNF